MGEIFITNFSYDQFCGLLRTLFSELGGGWPAGWGAAKHADLVVLFLDSDCEIIRIRNGIKYLLPGIYILLNSDIISLIMKD